MRLQAMKDDPLARPQHLTGRSVPSIDEENMPAGLAGSGWRPRLRLDDHGLAGQAIEGVEMGQVFARLCGLHGDAAKWAMADGWARRPSHATDIGVRLVAGFDPDQSNLRQTRGNCFWFVIYLNAGDGPAPKIPPCGGKFRLRPSTRIWNWPSSMPTARMRWYFPAGAFSAAG